MPNHYTIFFCDIEEHIHLPDDFKKNGYKTVKISYRGDNNPFLHFLRRVHDSYRLNQILHLPLRHLWYDWIYHKFDNPEKETAIFFATSFHKYNADAFFKAWNKRKINTYVIFLDSMDTNSTICPILRKITKYISPDHILSYDKNDCKKYGFNYLNESYYPDMQVPKVKVENDLYFIAHIKPERIDIIDELNEMFKRHGVKAKFDIIGERQYDKWYFDGDKKLKTMDVLDELVPYEKVIENVAKSNCILEIGQSGQNAPTFRYFEAVVCNKKLLTNVKYTEKLNFYNPKYMKITDFDEKNIDFDWIKKREKIDYKYKNEFSPINILSIIDKLEKSK